MPALENGPLVTVFGAIGNEVASLEDEDLGAGRRQSGGNGGTAHARPYDDDIRSAAHVENPALD